MTAPVERSDALVERIRAEIAAAGPITFARFMELALYEPELGYYRQPADRPTDAGDFLTAPEAHPIFGWTLARQIEQMWELLGSPRPFDLVEYGAGSGTLGLAILDAFRRGGSGLFDAVRYRPIESNPHRLADLRERSAAVGLAGRVDLDGEADRAEGGSGAVLANEFLDALPVHRVVVRRGELRELYVTWRDGFVEEDVAPSTPALARRLEDDGVTLEEGQVGEICLEIEPWLDDVARRLARGYLMVIDYGYQAAELYGSRHRAGTLLAYRGHRVGDELFRDPGEQDLTAHVDFTAVERLAAARGFAPLGLVRQADFLVAAGLADELQRLQASESTTFADYTRARSTVGRLLDPRALGRFRVFVAGRDVPGDVPLSGLAAVSAPG